MAVTLSSLAGAGAQFFDNNGVPLAGGLIYTYLAGTNTPAATYTSSTGSIAHSNPIVLDAAGRIATGEVWLTSGVEYKFIVKTSVGVQLGSYDNIPSINDFTSIYAALANTANPALGDALVGFRQSNSAGNLSGAVGRTVHQKLQEFVSVKDFGATGDGTTDDSAAIQAALNAGTAIYFPTGTYLISSTLNLPNKNMTLTGEGRLSKIIGSVSPLLAYDPTFNTNTPCIYDLSFEATGDNISIQMHGVWTAAGKVGPTIDGCYFLNSSVTTTTAKCISLSGVWTANITNNHFDGAGSGGAPTTGIGGYGIFILLGSNVNTSVMGLNITNNKFLTIAYPYWGSPRTLSTGGRIEGISISTNSFIAGNVAITSNQALATLIGNNIISDFNVGIDFIDEFNFNITGNTEIDGLTAGIRLSVAVGISERGVICANNIKAKSTGNIGIELINNIAASRLRSISITSNDFSAVISGVPSSIGIKFNNTFTIQNITITGNTFQQLLTAVDVGTIANQFNTINANNGTFVTNPISILSSGYAVSSSFTLVGGAATEDINIPIPVGIFFRPPIVDGRVPVSRLEFKFK
jgi:polygalacturonase